MRGRIIGAALVALVLVVAILAQRRAVVEVRESDVLHALAAACDANDRGYFSSPDCDTLAEVLGKVRGQAVVVPCRSARGPDTCNCLFGLRPASGNGQPAITVACEARQP